MAVTDVKAKRDRLMMDRRVLLAGAGLAGIIGLICLASRVKAALPEFPPPPREYIHIESYKVDKGVCDECGDIFWEWSDRGSPTEYPDHIAVTKEDCFLAAVNLVNHSDYTLKNVAAGYALIEPRKGELVHINGMPAPAPLCPNCHFAVGPHTCYEVDKPLRGLHLMLFAGFLTEEETAVVDDYILFKNYVDILP